MASSVDAKSEFALFFKLLVASLCVRMVEWSGEVSCCDSIVIVIHVMGQSRLCDL